MSRLRWNSSKSHQCSLLIFRHSSHRTQVADGWYRHLSYKIVAKLRAGLTDAITQKLLRLRLEKGLESKVLTLMVTDMQRVCQAFVSMHDLWSAPVDTGGRLDPPV